MARLRYPTLVVEDYDEAIVFGVVFEQAPRREAYGTVAVFLDVAGNRWDLLS